MAKRRASESGISTERLIELAIQGLKSSAEAIQHEIADLEHRLVNTTLDVVKDMADGTQALLAGKPERKKRRMSPAARARIAAAQRARWAKRKGASASKKTVRKARKVSASAKRAASERMKAYWAKRRAGK
jgi:hypothetical protein